MPRTLISPWVTASSTSSASFTSSPSSATNGSGSGTYTYDGNGQRVEKVSGGTTIVTIFAGSQVLAEYYNNAQPSSPTNEYIYAGSLMIASIQSGTTDYWHNDHLSPRVRTDTSGNVADQRGTFPFGETWYSPGSSPYMFTSYYRDYEAAGNDYAQARTYVGGLGRFSSPDPVSGSTSDPQSLNRYSYVRNMPVMLTDPFGLTPSCNTAKNPDTSQPQDSKSGGGPSATDSGDPSEAEPQSASQNPCDQDPWYYGGGSGLVSIDSGEGFDPGDGGSGLTGIGSDPFSILDAAFTPTSYQTIDNPDCGPALDCPTGTPPEITVPVYGNLGLLALLGGPGDGSTDQIRKLRSAIVDALLKDTKCLTFLGGRGTGSGPLSIVENTPISVAPYSSDPTNLAKTTSSGINSTITVNAGSYFFTQGQQAYYGTQIIGTGTPRLQAAALLHEFAHVAGVIYPNDQGDPLSEQGNNQMVVDNCLKTINSFRNK